LEIILHWFSLLIISIWFLNHRAILCNEISLVFWVEQCSDHSRIIFKIVLKFCILTMNTHFPKTVLIAYKFIVNYKKETPTPYNEDGLVMCNDCDDSNAGQGKGTGLGDRQGGIIFFFLEILFSLFENLFFFSFAFLTWWTWVHYLCLICFLALVWDNLPFKTNLLTSLCCLNHLITLWINHLLHHLII